MTRGISESDLTSREKQIICGLFLSKHDRCALEYLGFSTFLEAFNVLGYSLHARPASIKNYRDEFDPYYANDRKGWHGRPLRAHCSLVRNAYDHWSIDQLGDLIARFILPEFAVQHIPEILAAKKDDREDSDSSFARRLITGKAAEEYFRLNYKSISEFQYLSIVDTTGWGCGFDFKFSSESQDLHVAVEVKGMQGRAGRLLFTDLEYEVAGRLSDRYCLFIVRNFAESPYHSIIRDPIHHGLQFTRIERQEIRVSWSANFT